MSSQPVPTFRAAHLAPYLKFFQEKGVYTEAVLSKFKLPTALEDQPEAILPLLPVVRLLSYLERTQGVHDSGILISNHINLKLLNPVNQQLISSAPTVQVALDLFLRAAVTESSVVEGWVSLEGDEVRLCNSYGISIDDEEIRIIKIHFLLLIIAVIRVFTGPRWFPRQIGFQCRTPLSPVSGKHFPGTQFVFGQPCSWLSIPKEMLGIRKSGGEASRRTTSSLLDEVFPSTGYRESFERSLKRVITAYLADGYPSIELAGEITGMSVRTLQRNLAQAKTSYSKLVEDARFEAASDLLKKSDTKIIDVAYAVGYEDPSHFARAFRRVTGITPRQYRLEGAA
jgi:AraC-like DNA-binding protein